MGVVRSFHGWARAAPRSAVAELGVVRPIHRTMLTPRQRKLAVFGAFSLITASIVVAWDVLSDSDDASQETTSHTATEAKARGILVMSLQASPAELALPGRTVHINSAWVEAHSHRTERLWGSSEQRLDGYSLCFTFSEGSIGHTHFLVPDDEGAGVGERSWSKVLIVYTTDLEHPSDATKIRLSLVSSWHDPRPKNIHFTAQP